MHLILFALPRRNNFTRPFIKLSFFASVSFSNFSLSLGPFCARPSCFSFIGGSYFPHDRFLFIRLLCSYHQRYHHRKIPRHYCPILMQFCERRNIFLHGSLTRRKVIILVPSIFPSLRTRTRKYEAYV